LFTSTNMKELIKKSIVSFLSHSIVWNLLSPINRLIVLIHHRKEKKKRQDLSNQTLKLISNENLIPIAKGPFKGLLYDITLPEYAETKLNKIIGAYEDELHNWLQKIKLNSYDSILNIGAAEGYYTVGLAKMFPTTSVISYEQDPTLNGVITKIVDINKLNNQVTIKGGFSITDIKETNSKRVLIFMDCEGCEKILIGQNAILKKCDLLIETHNHIVPFITNDLIESFTDTHIITAISSSDGTIKVLKNHPELNHLSYTDQITVLNEGRPCSSQWLLFESKNFIK